jgi:16S rRNA (cytidine1402-2'-O)-methyltransferase
LQTGGVRERNGSAAPSKPDRDLRGPDLAPGLHVVATPIGNAADISLRALKVLAGADAIACEDTRVTGKLLAIHGISNALTPYHEHNAERALPKLMERLEHGETVALVSDAGTPLVSDPGFRLVRACLDAGMPVTAVPGPSAALAALVLSGLPSDRFLFDGFLPAKTAARKTALAELADVPATLIFQESARRLAASLAAMAEILGARNAAVARELTKKFEEVRRGTLGELAAHYGEAGPPKGEVVVVVAPPGAKRPDVSKTELDALLRARDSGESVRDAARRIAAETGLSRRAVYARALELAGDG